MWPGPDRTEGPAGGPAAVPVRVMATQPWAGPSQVKRERGSMSRRGAEYRESESVSRSPCPTLCDPVACSPPGSSVHGILQAFSGVGCHFLLPGIFLTQGSSPCLLHCRQILYHLSQQGSPGCWR